MLFVLVIQFTCFYAVPVTSVALSPSTAVTTINVSQSATFECTVPRSLPSATIVWYKNISGVISNPIPSSSSQISPNSDRTVTTSGKLMFSPSKEDNGVGMYCTASSGGASLTSRQILVNVQCKFNISRLYNTRANNPLDYTLYSLG